MNKKMKLGVFYWHNPTRIGNLQLVNELRQNFEIILISNVKLEYLKGFADYLICKEFNDPSEVIAALKMHKSKHGLDGLITLSEGAVTLMADAAREIGLPGNNPEKTRLGRNKYLMRQALKKSGIPQPRFFKVSSLEEAQTIFKSEFGNKPFFLKPPCIGGSSFCTIVKNQKQLKDIWGEFFEGSRIRTSSDPLFEEQFGLNGCNYYMLMEELMTGTNFPYDDVLGPKFPIYELSVEGFISGGSTFVYSMTDKLLPKNCKFGEEYMWRMHSRVPTQLKEILAERVNKVNRAFGATMGCSHTEFRIEECEKAVSDIKFKDKYYRARVIESALRPGGAYMQSAIYLATGFNSIRAMAYQACGLNHNEKVLFRHPIIMANLWPNKAGKLLSVDGLDKILSLKESLLEFHLYDPLGGIVEVPPIASRGMADAVLQGQPTNLLEIPNWEIKSGTNSPYHRTEKLYLETVANFKPKVK